MKISSVLIVVSILIAVAAWLLARLDRFENRLEAAESSLKTLEPLSHLLAQVRPPEPGAYQPVQATGAPNVPAEASDSALAWCPGVENGGQEWLLLGFEDTLVTTAVEVHANFNPGAVVKAVAVVDDGTETELWSGPAQPEGAERMTRFALAAPVGIKRVKLTLDTGAVRGWNEIDAVALVSADGSRHWATQAEASSSWKSGSGD